MIRLSLRYRPQVLAALGILLGTIYCGPNAVARAGDDGHIPAAARPFFQSHCVDCHGADEQRAKLRLDTLGTDLSDPRIFETWGKVYDQLVTGKMPPQDYDRPPQDEIDALTKQLQKTLHDVSYARQQQRGRVIVRRLNGTEYENTIRGLVGTQVRVKELLPPDDSVDGFDKVSRALNLSATHLLLYQQAAEKAIASAVPLRPPVHFEETRSGREMSDKGPNFRSTLNRTCKLDGDALIFYSRLPRYGLCCTANVPVTGRYRIQMKACAVGNEGKPIAVGYHTFLEDGPVEPLLHEVHEIQPGEPRVYEFEFDLERRRPFVANLLQLANPIAGGKKIEDYAGPGLRVDWLRIEGPIDAFPPPSYKALFDDLPLHPRTVATALAAGAKPPTLGERNEYSWLADPLVPHSDDPKRDSERLLRRFAQRAVRRPASNAWHDRLVQLVHAKLDEGYLFYDAMLFGFKLVLSSPEFLFVNASANVADDGRVVSPQLDDFALAERLSYFLWSNPPDEELLQLAKDGRLASPEVLRSQTERMLDSPRAQNFVHDFVGQWLDLRKIEDTIPDPQLYGEFNDLLLWSMSRETELFFEEVLKNDRPLTEFVHSDWTMLNERLARHYGIEGVAGSEFRKVKLPAEAHRGGVITQASVLKVTADGTRTSPILRGKWVLERIVGQVPPPPPPGVPTIEPDIRGATTIRQQLEKHRALASCASCHKQIDPPGFALETYDPIGNWREFYRVTVRPEPRAMPVEIGAVNARPIYRGPDVEKGFQMSDGRSFANIDEYKQILLGDKDQLARNLAEKLIVYSTGGEIQFADREVVEQIVDAVRNKHYGFRSLIHEVVQSRVFRNK
jgi:hypothetical protein